MPPSPPEALARLFHETYERLAPVYGYKRTGARPWDDLPPANRELMVAVCAEVLNHLHAAE